MINIAIPNYKFLEPIVFNIKQFEESSNIKVFEVAESDCYDLLATNKVDVALFTPLDYGKILKNADLRIIPTVCYAMEGFTGIFSLYFKAGLDNIEKCPAPANDDYLTAIFKILLAEKYEIHSEILKSNKTPEELLDEYKITFHYDNDDKIAPSMDLSEEWFDSNESILPVCFWVVRNEEAPDNIVEFVSLIKKYPTQEYIPVSKFDHSINEDRTGNIILKWSDEIEKSLENVLDMLYFYQYIPEIPEIKLLGETTEEIDEIAEN